MRDGAKLVRMINMTDREFDQALKEVEEARDLEQQLGEVRWEKLQKSLKVR